MKIYCLIAAKALKVTSILATKLNCLMKLTAKLNKNYQLRGIKYIDLL